MTGHLLECARHPGSAPKSTRGMGTQTGLLWTHTSAGQVRGDRGWSGAAQCAVRPPSAAAIPAAPP